MLERVHKIMRTRTLQETPHATVSHATAPTCRFWANQFRLLLHAAAYWLLDTLRRWLCQAGLPRLRLGTLRLRLIKIGGWVRERARGVAVHLASSHPGEPLWRLLAAHSLSA